MGKQRSRQSRVSNGGRAKANKAHWEKKQAKFAAKREAGKAYKWEPNPYKPGSEQWQHEQADRVEKAKSARLPYAQFVSIMAKLENKLAAEQMANKERKASAPKREKSDN